MCWQKMSALLNLNERGNNMTFKNGVKEHYFNLLTDRFEVGTTCSWTTCCRCEQYRM